MQVVQSGDCPVCGEEYEARRDKAADPRQQWPGGIVYAHDDRLMCWVPDLRSAPVVERETSYKAGL